VAKEESETPPPSLKSADETASIESAETALVLAGEPDEAMLLTETEEVVDREFDLYKGGKLHVRKTHHYTVQGISTELAAHRLQTQQLKCQTRIRLEEIQAEARIKVAEAKHVTPFRLAVRPIWGAMGILGALAVSALLLGQPQVSVVCAIAIGGLVAFRGVSDWLKARAGQKSSDGD
jgi:hypothetical protein